MNPIQKLFSLVKDLRVRFALAMLGNFIVLWFLANYFKQFIPNLPPELNF